MSDIPDCDARVFKAAILMIREMLKTETVVILAQRGDDKLMQVGGGKIAASILMFDGARQVAKQLKDVLMEHIQEEVAK